MIQLHHERMSDTFEKWNITGLLVPMSIHHFTGPDRGYPHDHPWPFTSLIISGGYVETTYTKDGIAATMHRRPGAMHRVEAAQIHRIDELPEGECWTLILPGEKVREPGFWRWEDGVPHYRQWDWLDFARQDLSHG